MSQSIKFLRHHKSLRKCSKTFQTKTDFSRFAWNFLVFLHRRNILFLQKHGIKFYMPQNLLSYVQMRFWHAHKQMHVHTYEHARRRSVSWKMGFCSFSFLRPILNSKMSYITSVTSGTIIREWVNVTFTPCLIIFCFVFNCLVLLSFEMLRNF